MRLLLLACNTSKNAACVRHLQHAAAARAAALAESAEGAVALAEKSCADKHHHHEAAKRNAALAEMALAEEGCQELAEGAGVPASPLPPTWDALLDSITTLWHDFGIDTATDGIP